MVVLIPVIAAGNLIPQRGRVAPWEISAWEQSYPMLSKVVAAAGLDHVYTSWWFLIVFSLLFLNMSLVTWALIRRTAKKAKGLHRFSPETVSYYSLGFFGYSDALWREMQGRIKSRRYRVVSSEDEIYARKGWSGIWGGTILHTGLIVLLAGAVVSGLTRFSGYTEMGEGQGFIDSPESYLQSSQGILFPGHRPQFTIGVSGIEEKDVSEKLKVVISTMQVIEDGKEVTSKTVRMNDPLYYKGMKIFQSRFAGPALLFRIDQKAKEDLLSNHPYAADSQPVAVGYVNLKKAEGTVSSVFPLKGTPFQAQAVYSGEDTIELEVRDKSLIVFRGRIGVEQNVLLDSLKITLLAINKWSGIIVVYDRAVPIVFSGFGLAIIGIAIMGLFDPREIWVKKILRNGSKKIEVLGWGRWKNMFHEEFREMMEDLK